MKKIFLLGVLAGFGAVLAGAHFYPWVDPLRVASHTSVVDKGGRAERFLIRLPADQLADFGPRVVGLRSVADTPQLPQDLNGRELVLEHFKLRDTDGKVIGLAVRHWTTTVHGNETAWVLMIPGRGTLVLAGAGEQAAAVDDALRGHGYVPGTTWSGNLTLRMGTGESPPLGTGDGEFAGLKVRYSETWSLTGVSSAGALRGTITLDTLSRDRS